MNRVRNASRVMLFSRLSQALRSHACIIFPVTGVLDTLEPEELFMTCTESYNVRFQQQSLSKSN